MYARPINRKLSSTCIQRGNWRTACWSSWVHQKYIVGRERTWKRWTPWSVVTQIPRVNSTFWTAWTPWKACRLVADQKDGGSSPSRRTAKWPVSRETDLFYSSKYINQRDG